MSAREPSDLQERKAFAEALSRACSALGLSIDPGRQARMYAHFQRVVAANRRFNLTRITSPVEAAVRHYADSLTLLAAPWFDRDRPLLLLDVGTGAGFPAVPLAIACPCWEIVAIDGTGKKIRFVAEAAAALGLGNLRARHARAADLVRESPPAFDLVVMRAVAKIAPGLKEVAGLLRPRGVVVFYKTAGIAPAERRQGRKMAESLGLTEREPFFVTLPTPDGELARQLIGYARG